MVGTEKQKAKTLELVKDVTKACNPLKIVLFGSLVTGKADYASDADLLVILDSMNKVTGVEVRQKIDRPGRGLPFDLYVITDERLKGRLSLGDIFLKMIIEQGEVLYEK